MPGPKNFKATKLGIIFSKQIAHNHCKLRQFYVLLDRLCIKYEIANAESLDDLIQYSALAKQRGLECVIAIADVTDKLPALCAKLCLVPLIFAPFSDGRKRTPSKNLALAPFCVTAVNKPAFAVLLAAKIIAIRDKSLARRLLQLNAV